MVQRQKHNTILIILHLICRYHTFHEAQMEVVSSYPSMVKGETQKYDAAVCKFFSVNRTHPDVSYTVQM